MIHTSLAKPICHLDESSSLMEFKQSFATKGISCVYSKVESWSLEEYGDCCSWDGFECNEATGHVTGLDLSNSCLFGTLTANTSLFRLLHLESLNLGWNDFNSSSIPYGFGNLSRLRYLNLSNSEFFGKVPSDISQLSRLVSLDLSLSWFLLEMPNIDNFVQNLTMLRELDLSLMSIRSPFPHVLANFSSLKSLKLTGCGLQGGFPVSIFQFPNLEALDVSDNRNLSGFIPKLYMGNPLKSLSLYGTNFSGEIPISIRNLIFLNKLSIEDCHFSGSLPTSLGNLSQLTYLGLSGNNLSGTMDVHKLKNLKILLLDFNNISFVSKTQINATLPKLSTVSLVSCNLHEFPKFLGYQNGLVLLSLSHNKIGESIPIEIWNGSRESLLFMDLSHNLLTGFENNQINLPLPKLTYLDISSNLLKTRLPTPPPLVQYYNLSNNILFGDIQSICRGRSLLLLDLSINSLSGIIPSCLGNIDSLSVMNLGKNNLEGMIPHAFLKGCALKIIDLTENRLQGSVPRSMVNCTALEYLNLGYNQILDGFPFWLSDLIHLKVIILKSNKFHGPIETYGSQFNFSYLHIMDLSNNSFSGELPSKLLQSSRAMKVIVSQDSLEYMYVFENTSWVDFVDYGMKLMNKGMEREYSKVPYALMEIDLSNNKFEGRIPNLVGDLKSLMMLNLSNNILTGSIPPSLANLTMLESLDLSRNKLSGEIPQQLAQLTFLSSFDVSHNQLSGLIPQGSQFNTFGTDSFVMNNRLCGSPLPNKCTKDGNNLPLPPSLLEEDNGEESLLDWDWKVVLIGVGVGFLIGVVLENLIIDEKGSWFLHYSKRMAKRWKRWGRH
ncbi:hypothetical protein BT93_L2427 [Corymbia citriodora subsp. variegata]|uniref:Leucine-rich repeat-containing N-terminal plant-type domain-containing protein n=1 Tax=Corymbia citriodora subsp. variegata TaxID=360336 RepID=A0A8T0CP28_CORYI|nr:hypothetical protein BT93_L2427 [Corymbia citriodora subsp. variegata]